MLTLTVQAEELWNESTQEFIQTKGQTLLLEHSLISLSKWEEKWELPFFKTEKNSEQTLDYIRCMTVSTNVDPIIYLTLTKEHIEQIQEYIEKAHTATTLGDLHKNKGGSREIVTAEVIYNWMIALQIPFECQKWHLNRLLMLIQVCNIKNSPPKKMSRSEIQKRNAALNAQRRARLNTTG